MCIDMCTQVHQGPILLETLCTVCAYSCMHVRVCMRAYAHACVRTHGKYRCVMQFHGSLGAVTVLGILVSYADHSSGDWPRAVSAHAHAPSLHTALCYLPMLTGPSDEVGSSPRWCCADPASPPLPYAPPALRIDIHHCTLLYAHAQTSK